MARLPNPHGRTLTGLLREQRRQLRQQGSASSFTRSGMNVTAEGVVTSDDFDGDVAARDAGSRGWALSRNALAVGDLILRPRSIGDDSLSSLVAPGALYRYTEGFPVTYNGANIISGSFTVPEGYTSAVVNVLARVFALNPTDQVDYLYARMDIGEYTSSTIPVVADANGGSAVNTPPLAGVLDGLTAGQTLPFAVFAYTGYAAWAFDQLNTADVSGSIVWFR